MSLALSHFDAVLVDHAHCERKAAASALSLVVAYPEDTYLVDRCVALAQEELRHFRQVHRLIRRRGGVLGRDGGDPYAKALLATMRHGQAQRRVDRLLVNALIEARSCERLGLLAQHLTDPMLREFYARLATAEAGHYRLFVNLARRHVPDESADAVTERLAELARDEAEIITDLPLLPRIH